MKLKLATMIITIIFGLTCIGLGVTAAIQEPTAVSNTSKIDISALGEPQADITIIGKLGTVANNNPGYPNLFTNLDGGGESVANPVNPYYLSLNPTATKVALDFTGAETLWTMDGRNPVGAASFNTLTPSFSMTSGYCYLAYRITIKCLDSTDIKFSLITSPINTSTQMVIEEYYVQVEGQEGVFVNSTNKSAHIDSYLYNADGSRTGSFTQWKTLQKGKTATITVLLKTDRSLNEIYADAAGNGVSIIYDIGMKVEAVA